MRWPWQRRRDMPDETPLPRDLDPVMPGQGNPLAFRCRWCNSTLFGPKFARRCPKCDVPPKETTP